MRSLLWRVRVTALYTRQRYKLHIFGGMALLLLLYAGLSVPLGQMLGNVVFALVFLWVLRLYDDLYSRRHDVSKSLRIYTKAKFVPCLQQVLWLIAGAMCLGVYLGYGHKVCGALLLYLLINHLLYFLFFERGKARYYLPLLKYPVFCGLLWMTAEQTLGWKELLLGLALFFAMVAFEVLEDAAFPQGVGPWIWIGLSLGVLWGVHVGFILGLCYAVAYIGVTVTIQHEKKYSPYVFLGVFVVLRCLGVGLQ